jgi:aldehyde dehydrogenase family protein
LKKLFLRQEYQKVPFKHWLEIQSAESLLDSDGVNAVITFTGSLPVGAKVAQRAISTLKKTVLELGERRRRRRRPTHKDIIAGSVNVTSYTYGVWSIFQ